MEEQIKKLHEDHANSDYSSSPSNPQESQSCEPRKANKETLRTKRRARERISQSSSDTGEEDAGDARHSTRIQERNIKLAAASQPVIFHCDGEIGTFRPKLVHSALI
jgi:hypothetical protein